MANSFNGKFRVISDFKYSSTLDIGTAIHNVLVDAGTLFTNGEGANQAEVAFTDQRTLAASTGEDLDLSGTSLQDAFGNNVAFTSIKVMIVSAASGNTNNVLVGGASATAFSAFVSDPTDEVVIVPGGTFVLIAPSAAGYAVSAGATDLLRIENSSSGTSVTYDITLIGTEA